jgi:hypothetical protein
MDIKYPSLQPVKSDKKGPKNTTRINGIPNGIMRKMKCPTSVIIPQSPPTKPEVR